VSDDEQHEHDHQGADMNLETIATQERVHNALSEFVEIEIDVDGDAYIEHEGVRAFLNVSDVDEQRSVLQVYTVTQSDFAPSPGLFRWVATTASKFRFGSLSARVDDNDRVHLTFSHSLVIDGLDDESLRLTILPVVYTAADLRREARQLFAG